jgi:DNA-directed RNA polymerase
MLQLGADRISLLTNRRRLLRMESLSNYGQSLTVAGIDQVIDVLRYHRRQIRDGGAGPRYAHLQPLLQLAPHKVAAVALRVIVDSITQVSKQHALAYEVADKLWMETMLARATMWERKNHKQRRMRLKCKTADILRMKNTIIWTPQERLSVGVFLIQLIAQYTGLIAVTLEQSACRKVRRVRATDACIAWIREMEEQDKMLCPFTLPMVIPPRPWEGVMEGGYLNAMHINPTLMKEDPELVAAKVTGTEPFIQAANHQQSVPYRVNGWVLEQLQLAWDKGLEIGSLMPREGWEVPPYPKHLPDDHPDVTQWKFNARQIHDRNDKTRNKRIATAKLLWVARRMESEPSIWFPMQLDFRGRYYYRPGFLNPQGSDMARALLLFANGTPITTDEEANWLRIHGANCYGYSKTSWQARLDWVHEHQLEIEATGRDPWRTVEFWSRADDPWQFLSFCRTYQEFSHQGYGYICHLPVVLDCTCSGIQHYAALLRSEEMAQLVNLLPSEQPQDIYTVVLNRVLAQVRKDAEDGDPHATSWLQLQPDRSLLKPVVMTTPYSATRRAIFGFCQSWAFDRTVELYGMDGWCFKKGAMAAMHYMTTIVCRETAEVIGPAKKAMHWLKQVGRLAGEHDIELSWTAPSGLPVHQRYMDYRGVRIKLHHLSPVSMDLLSNHIPDGLSPKRMGNGLSPNVIHSLDASHMALSTIDAFSNGVHNLGGIHDCFSTTPAEMAQVRNSVRNAFAAMYQHDWFSTITGELLRQIPLDLQHKLAPVPKLSRLDVTTVQHADYFIT